MQEKLTPHIIIVQDTCYCPSKICLLCPSRITIIIYIVDRVIKCFTCLSLETAMFHNIVEFARLYGVNVNATEDFSLTIKDPTASCVMSLYNILYEG